MKAGESIGAYVVVRQLGSGGMGAVYLAEHSALGRRAAIKVLQPELTSNPQMVTRFFNEARAASAIKSPGIVEIYDFGTHVDGSAYIVMELLEGEALAARLHRLGRLPLAQALIIGRRIASALAPAHRAGIVHRDLKPDNVFLVLDEEVAGGERIKLLDFGIAKLLGDGEPGGIGKLTSTKMVMGTPHYMSPEQCRGAGAVDARSDLYALGCILFELISGQPPFTGEGAGDLIGAHIYLPPRRLSEMAPGVPFEIDELVQRLLAKQAAQRPQSAEEVAAALSALVSRFGGDSQQMPSTSGSGIRAVTANPAAVAMPPANVAVTMMATERPAQRPTESAGKRRSGLIFALVALVVVAGGGYAATRLASESSTEQSAAGALVEADAALVALASEQAPDAALPPEAEALVAMDAALPPMDAALPPMDAAPLPIDAAVAISPDAASSKKESPEQIAALGADSVGKRKRSECMRLQRDEKWAALKKCAEGLRATRGINPTEMSEAEDYGKQAAKESLAKAALDAFLKAQRAGNMRAMGSVVERFDRSSLYWDRTRKAWEAQKSAFISAQVERVKKANAKGECGTVQEIAKSIALYDSTIAQAMSRSCNQGEDRCESPGTRRASDQLYDAVLDARIKGNHAELIGLVDQALADQCLALRHSILARFGIIAACAAKRRDKTRAFYAKSKDPSMIAACPDYLSDVK